MKLHFISGLPRSGSTLLAALLRQNPEFHAAMSTPLAQIVMAMQRATSRGAEGAVFISEDQRRRLLRSVFLNYYAGTEGVVFDTNRVWCAKMPLLAGLFPESKVICCVRNIAWIINSVEKLIQANPLELSGIFGFETGGTVFTRAQALAAADGMVGYPLNALREAYYGPFADRLLVLDYEALVRAPKQSMDYIYEFLEEPIFHHDFDNFEYEAEEFDANIGTPGLHRVHGPVRWRDQAPVLPPNLFDSFAAVPFWQDQMSNIKGVRVMVWGGQNNQNLRVVR